MAECNDCTCVCVDLAAVPRTISMGNDCLCILLICKTTQSSPTVSEMKRKHSEAEDFFAEDQTVICFKATRKSSEQLPLAADLPNSSPSPQ
jgi:hypothetical protein